MTTLYVGIVVMQIAGVFACRSVKYSVFKIGFLDNRLILWSIILELIFVSIIIYTPFFQKIFNTTGLGWTEWGILFIFASLIFLAEELRKKLYCRRYS